MSDTFARTPSEELLRVVEEIAGMKNVVREVSDQLRRMERRVKTALAVRPGTAGARAAVRPPSAVRASSAANGASRMSEEAARAMLEKMTEQTRRGESVEEQLRAMTVKGDLAAIARVLGLTYAKFPKSELIRMILVKIREDVLLSERYGSGADAPEKK